MGWWGHAERQEFMREQIRRPTSVATSGTGSPTNRELWAGAHSEKQLTTVQAAKHACKHPECQHELAGNPNASPITGLCREQKGF
eukprot:6742013-Pyramimonas_sp.AAC.1